MSIYTTTTLLSEKMDAIVYNATHDPLVSTNQLHLLITHDDNIYFIPLAKNVDSFHLLLL
jgi:hypothetical protein